MGADPVDYHSFLLRLWRTDADGPWQASLEDPVTGERTGFKSVRIMVAFLLATTSVITPQDKGINIYADSP